MFVFRNVVFTAALAGLVAGLLLALVQAFSTDPLILQAEVYENAAPTHAHAHDHSAAPQANADAATPVEAEDEGWAPADGIERFVSNALANVVGSVGFALMLVAASELAGGVRNWRDGLFWGLAGFAVFTLAPGLGLPPEPPAMPVAELLSRQIWWVATAAATAAGLALITFRRSAPLALLAVALLVAPHVVGAPQPASYETPIPEALHHSFAVASTVSSFVFWLALGAMVGILRSRFLGRSEAAALPQGRLA